MTFRMPERRSSVRAPCAGGAPVPITCEIGFQREKTHVYSISHVEPGVSDIRSQEVIVMRIFYIGQLWEGGTALERMKALNSLGHLTVPFDVSSFAHGVSRPLQSIAARFHLGPILTRLNHALKEQATHLGPITHIWIDKGVWIYPKTLEYIKSLTGAVIVHYTPDPQFLFHRSRHFIRAVPLYDVLVTTKEWEIPHYKEVGAKRIILTHQGYDLRCYPRNPSQPIRSTYASDVCFIGHHERHYAQRLMKLTQPDINLRIWGPRWPRYAKWQRVIRPCVSGGGLWGEEYVHAISSAKIGLGLLSKWVPETSTTRTFEIPAMGTFLLAERTALHQQLFDEGKEAEFFSSDDEMLDKTRFYLIHDETRKMIAAAGRARCEKSGYSSTQLMSQIISSLSDGS